MDSGKGPVNWLRCKSSWRRHLKFPIQKGIGPRTLQLAIKSASSWVKFDRLSGRGQEANWFPPVYSPKLRRRRLTSFDIDKGMAPLKLFPKSCSSSSSVRSPILFGIWPRIPQRQIQSLFKDVNMQISSGRDPLSEGIVASSIIRRCFKLLIEVGSLPLIEFVLITMECTLLPRTPTLYHSLTGAVEFQFTL